jgi:hypothetical protein
VNERILVIDDHLLLRVLLRDEPPDLRPHRARLFSTGLCYHRLCRALRRPEATGTLSRQLGTADPDLAAAVLASVTSLPEDVGLLSLRELAWPMAQLVDGGIRLDLLSLEALAAAKLVGCILCVALVDGNPPLLEAAAQLHVSTRIVRT